jgi:hypothetical protein
MQDSTVRELRDNAQCKRRRSNAAPGYCEAHSICTLTNRFQPIECAPFANVNGLRRIDIGADTWESANIVRYTKR